MKLVLRMCRTLAFAVLCLALTAAAADFQRIEITRGWSIKALSPRQSLDAAALAEAVDAPEKLGWLKTAAMPAMVHDILLNHGKMETPWLPGRAEKCKWVAEQDWLYSAQFAADHPELDGRLRFTGLDTDVDVYLNGERVASHDNMFTPLVVNVSGKLRAQNSLVLHFHTVFDFPGGKPVARKQLRRSAQNYGSYLGPYPYFSRVGIYDGVFLEVTGGSALNEVVAGASLNEALTAGDVTVDVAGVSRQPAVAVQVRVVGPDGSVSAVRKATAVVRDGAFTARVVAPVTRPRLWWPRGYGVQPLYRAEVALLVQGHTHQTEVRTLGFRRVTMPERLHFVINGVPVRLWGGDWVTPRWDTAVWDQPRVDSLFALAENANFNAFRVWAEVESPRDAFYEMADARGFLIWQDFTHLPLGPGQSARETCRREATDFVKRLKHHPAIVAWNGNNEGAMWNHQEFNAQLEDRGAWPGLAAAEDVGEVVRKLDPERYYQPSSPYFGADPNDPREGNTHGYTNLWFVPGYDYLNFASEDTRIAAPVLSSLRRFMAPEDLWPSGYATMQLPGGRYPYPKSWLRYTTGQSWKKVGPVEQFYDATDAAGLVYRLGMAEALYYEDTVERQRRGREATDTSGRRRCGGYIVWKFNDSWPQVYSAKVDYFLEPYHAYYALRRAFAPVLLSFDVGTYIYLWAVNDSPQTVSGTATLQLFHLERNQFRKPITRAVTLPPGESKVIVRLDEAGIGSFRREHVLFARLTDASGREIARANAPVEIERRIDFPDARLTVKVENGTLVLSTDKFARAVTLEGDGEGSPWFFEDNYFDLLPGEIKKVRILGRRPQGRVTARPWYSSQATTVDWRR